MRVAGEDGDGVGALVGDEQPVLGGVEGEMAGDGAAAGAAPLVGETAAVGRDGEGGEEVVAAVGDVGEAGVAVEDDVVAGGGAFVGLEREGEVLHGGEGAGFGVPAEDHDA